MIPFTAEFVTSAFALDGCPRWKRAEVALAGRSNVGKSSLLNALVGVKGLARTSKTPGRTRCLNFFAVGGTLALCDLPGFGYAKMSHDDAAKIALRKRNVSLPDRRRSRCCRCCRPNNVSSTKQCNIHRNSTAPPARIVNPAHRKRKARLTEQRR